MIWNEKTKGFAIGVGVAILIPIAYEVVATLARPAAKKVIKEGMKLAEKGMEKVAEAGETFEDLVAEARAEVDEEMMAGAVSIEPEEEVSEKAKAEPAPKQKSTKKKSAPSKAKTNA
jgi:hypothetical protein